MNRLNVCIVIILLCFANVACGVDNYKKEYRNEKDFAETKSEIVQNETKSVTKSLPYENCNKLKSVLNMMVVYDFSYTNLTNTPDGVFWDKFSTALLCNSWYDGFGYLIEEYGTTLWDNQKVAYAASLLTGKELKCQNFPKGIDLAVAASPYVFEWKQENVSIETLGSNRWELCFDFIWLSSSIDTKKQKKEVTAIIVTNKDSPFEGYSIESIEINKIF